MKKRRRSNKRAARNGYRRTSASESEGALMAKRWKNGQRAAGEGERRTENPDELRTRWIMEGIPVLIAKDFSDSEDSDPQPMAALKGEAMRDIEELARQIHRCCSDKKWTSYQKRVACEQLVNLAFLSTNSLYRLAEQFPEPFREIAEELPAFPCLFPAHGEDLPALKMIIWDKFNLGKRHTLKLRAAPGRKTFSTKTWANKLLTDLIQLVHELAREEVEGDPGGHYEGPFEEVAYHVPLTPQNTKEWLDVIWKLLLNGIPNPETHPRLRQLVERPSLRRKRMRRDGTVGEKTQAHNIRASIKAKLGVYLKRMLNDPAIHK
jgi:hypothetical protein